MEQQRGCGLLFVLALAAATLAIVEAKNSHPWMDKVPLKKLDKKSKLTGQGVTADDHLSKHSENIGMTTSFEASFSKVGGDEKIDDHTAEELSWDVVDADGTMYEAVLTKETLSMMMEADGKNKKRRRSKPPRGVRDDQKKVEQASRAILGADTRYDIACGSETSYPRSAVGRWSAGLDSSSGGGCSATLIGPRHVLTAGHCVHGGKGGDWVGSNFKFRPQQNCNSTHAPLGTYSWRQIYSVKGWTQDSKYDYDYALVILSSDVGTWMSFGYNNGLSTGTGIYINGYPMQDKLDWDMWGAYGTISDVSSRVFKSANIDTVPGNSGSGVVYYNNKWIAIGVHSGSERRCRPNFPDFWNQTCKTRNREVRISKSRFEQICGWMNTNLC